MSNLVQAGMAWKDIAASAYRAYAASTGNKNYQGLPMPAFDALPVAIQIAWEAAVRQVGYCFDNHHSYQGSAQITADEQHWQGYVPPHLTS